MADGCQFFTGADLKALLYDAQLAAIHELQASVGWALRTGALGDGASGSEASASAERASRSGGGLTSGDWASTGCGVSGGGASNERNTAENRTEQNGESASEMQSIMVDQKCLNDSRKITLSSHESINSRSDNLQSFTAVNSVEVNNHTGQSSLHDDTCLVSPSNQSCFKRNVCHTNRVYGSVIVEKAHVEKSFTPDDNNFSSTSDEMQKLIRCKMLSCCFDNSRGSRSDELHANSCAKSLCRTGRKPHCSVIINQRRSY